MRTLDRRAITGLQVNSTPCRFAGCHGLTATPTMSTSTFNVQLLLRSLHCHDRRRQSECQTSTIRCRGQISELELD